MPTCELIRARRGPRQADQGDYADLRPEVAMVRFPDSCYGQTYVEDGIWDWHGGLYGTPEIPSTEDTRAWFGLWNLLTCGVSGHDGITFFNKYFAAELEGEADHIISEDHHSLELTSPGRAASSA